MTTYATYLESAIRIDANSISVYFIRHDWAAYPRASEALHSSRQLSPHPDPARPIPLIENP